MRQCSKKTRIGLIVFIFALIILSKPLAVTNQIKGLKISGVNQYSFSSDYVLVTSGRTVFRINKNKLNPIELEKFNHTNIDMVIPADAVDMTWTTSDSSAATIAKAQDSSKSDKGRLNIHGTLLYSDSPDIVMIQAADNVFRLKKELLSSSEQDLLKRVGASVDLSVPTKAVDSAWTYSVSNARTPASLKPITQEQYVHKSGELIEISGKVLYSFSGSFCLLQAKRVIFEVDCSANKDLNSVGKNIKIAIPAKTIQNTWVGEQAGL